MSTLTEIEKAIEALPPEQWAEIRRWMGTHAPRPQDGAAERALPLVAATGRAITQREIDDALDAD